MIRIRICSVLKIAFPRKTIRNVTGGKIKYTKQTQIYMTVKIMLVWSIAIILIISINFENTGKRSVCDIKKKYI